MPPNVLPKLIGAAIARFSLLLTGAAHASELDLPVPAGIHGQPLLMGGLGVCVLGLIFGLVCYKQLQNLPVHKSMLEISDLIYETCKTYLITQGKFLMLLWAFIAVIIVAYFGFLHPIEGHPVSLTVP